MRLLIVVFLGSLLPQASPAQRTHRLALPADWSIQSSAKVPQPPEQISVPNFDTRGWYRTRVPATVLSTLVNHGVYPDPYYAMNLRDIPGTTYEIGDNFANDPVPPDSPFAVSWWYRTEFHLPPQTPGNRLWLNFESINYSANIWLNGHRIATANDVRGMYRSFEFDVTGIAASGANALAVEVFAADENALGLTFVDWNPLPPDKDMGIVRGVSVLSTGPVAVHNVQVVSKVDNSLDRAHLTFYADLHNAGDQAVNGTLQGTVGGLTVFKSVRLNAGEIATIAFTPQEFPQLDIQNPQLWWPYELGAQNLQTLHMEFRAGGAVTDQQDVSFGIREFTSELDALHHRLFRINGKRILIRGGGYTHDMMLRTDPERQENEFRYVRDMHLNTLRLEGKLLDENFFNLADRYGILVMPGWCCCAYWEQWDRWQPEDYTVAAESMRTQLRRLRNHASVFVFLYGSDVPPNDDGEQVYLDVLRQEHWPNPTISAARDSTTKETGLTGVKMTGPYDYVPPNYWLSDTRWGGAWGFNTETSPGHAIPELPSLQQMLPAEHLWPIDDFWNFHGASQYPVMDVYTAALSARYGPSADVADFVKKSQMMAYEGERAMFEAYGRNKYTATGVIQWMLNNAWPSIVWHLYDYYLRTGGGYFGTKKANEPVHVQYSFDDRSVVVVNSLYRSFAGYRVTAQVFNLDLQQIFSQTTPVDITEDSATRVFTLPAPAGLSRTYFVRLQLNDADGNPVSHNFYWLSTQPDEVDWAAQTDYFYTPIKTHADLTALQSLPPATLTVTSQSEDAGTDRIEHITVRNTSATLAFGVHLTTDPDFAPVIWEDNYFELFPGESRTLNATFALKLLQGRPIHIHAESFN